MSINRRIIGICLVRNEERFLDLVLANIIDFCDQILIADNKSTDQTLEIAKRWEACNASVSVNLVKHPVESHEMLIPFVDSPTWIFAVDGDEVYDPVGLALLREEILSGKYDGYWRIIGNVLNCVQFEADANKANGYLSPPSRSITKLYNFNAIVDWSGVRGERLHGGEVSFKKGYSESNCLRLHDKIPWEKSNFRCLHLCFLSRSSKDRRSRDGAVTRRNLAEKQNSSLLRFFCSKITESLGISMQSSWKYRKYGRGDLESKDITNFLQNNGRQAIS